MHKALFTTVGMAACAAWSLGLSRQAPGEPAVPRGDGQVIALEALASHPLALAGEPRDVYLYVSLRAADLPAVPRPSMNLALVVDRSGSMASEDKLRFARSAAEQLVGRLKPDDHLAIVTYDNEVETVLGSAPVGERDATLAAIRGIQTGGNTNLHGGMVAGYEEVLQHFDAKRANRVLLLSDGLANEGVTDPTQIAARAARCRERGVRISTMGMGLSYDEDLMIGIAEGSGGNYYYVDAAESVGHHLDAEIDQLSKLVARDLEVRLDLGDGVELIEVFGYRFTMEGRTAVVSVRDMYSGERRKVVLRLRLAGRVGEERTLATAALRYVDAVSNESRASGGRELLQRFSSDPDAVARARRLDVLTKVEVVHNAATLDAAMELQKRGMLEAAQGLLTARYRNSKLLNDTEYKSAEVTRMLEKMKQVLLDLERTAADPEAQRDLQLMTQLQALGYMGGD